MKAKHIIYILAALAALPVSAQEKLNETLYVEGEYVPTVVRQDKIHLLPQKISFDMPAVEPPAQSGLLTGNYAPHFGTLTTPVWRGNLRHNSRRGYLNAALGSFLNSSLSAGYGVIENEHTRLNVWLQHNSTSLFHPRISPATADCKRFRYDEQAGADLRHDFGNNGVLTAAVNYHFGYFNYYGAAMPQSAAKAPEQTLNDAALQIAWQSAQTKSWQWSAHASAGYFGYRRIFVPSADYYAADKGAREFEASVGATAMYRFAGSQTIGVDADFTNLGYNRFRNQAHARSLQTLRIAPAYTFAADRFSTRLGVVADITWGAGRSAQTSDANLDYSTLHVAPDVRLSYDGGAWGVHLSAGGGQLLQSMRSGYELDYYQQPAPAYIQPAFVPLEANLRLQLNGNAKFRAGIDVTYKNIRHLFYGGWYMANLSTPAGQAPEATTLYGNLGGFSIGVDAEWRPIEILTLSGRGTYQPQSAGTKGFFNGYDRPRWVVEARADISPVRGLTLSPGYRYRGVRNIYMGTTDTNHSRATRLPGVCNLRMDARYRFTDSFSIYGSADNLLCKRTLVLPNQPEEGFNFLIGIDLLF